MQHLTPKDSRPSRPTSHAKAGESVLPEEEISFAELDNGSLVETIEDPTDSKRTALAVFRSGRIRVTNRLTDKDRILVPIPRSAVGFSEMKLPRGILPYRSTLTLLSLIVYFLAHAVDLPREYLIVVASFALYSWVSDRLRTAVYLSIVGLPQSGKSTLLEALSLICRRPVLVSNISNAALYEACSRLHPTFLIDEVDWHFSATAGTMRQLLRAGTGPSAQVLRSGRSALSFGPKVFCSLEPFPDQALSSRCIQIPMAETGKGGLLKPGDPSMIELASTIRQQLLRFRFVSKFIRAAEIPGAERLRPRSRDLLGSLAAPLAKYPPARRALREFFETHQDPSTREPLEPRQEALVAAVFANVHVSSERSSVRIGGEHGLTEDTSRLLQLKGERVGLTEKACGSLLTSLGFRSKHRTNCGWILWLDASTRDRCHQLVKTHGNRFVKPSVLARLAHRCLACADMLP